MHAAKIANPLLVIMSESLFNQRRRSHRHKADDTRVSFSAKQSYIFSHLCRLAYGGTVPSVHYCRGSPALRTITA